MSIWFMSETIDVRGTQYPANQTLLCQPSLTGKIPQTLELIPNDLI